MKLSKSLFFVFIACNAFSQKNSKVTTSEVYYSDNPILNIILEKVESPEICFKASYPYSSSNIYFYGDSTFVFYYVDVETYDMVVGKYSQKGRLTILVSDSAATAKAVRDPSFYKKYFKFKPPTALHIEQAAYFFEDDLLIPFHNSFEKDKIKLCSASRDFLSHKLQMSVYKDIHYNLSGKRIVVDYSEKDKFSLSVDSLWGFITFKKGALKMFRTTPKGFNWYGVPGVQIVQTDPFIIYTVGEGRIYSYFSKDLNSKIYPLDLNNIKREFNGNTAFIKALNKEFGDRRVLSAKGRTTNSYRVLEIYKEARVNKAPEQN